MNRVSQQHECHLGDFRFHIDGGCGYPGKQQNDKNQDERKITGPGQCCLLKADKENIAAASPINRMTSRTIRSCLTSISSLSLIRAPSTSPESVPRRIRASSGVSRKSKVCFEYFSSCLFSAALTWRFVFAFFHLMDDGIRIFRYAFLDTVQIDKQVDKGLR